MVAANWPESLRRLLEHEGGNDDDPRDPGGRTSRGIIQSEWTRYVAAHPGLPADVWKAPQSAVEDIYRRQYWDALRCDELPAGVDYAVFDFGVNSGIGRAARYLQLIVGTAQDGQIGPATLAAVRGKRPIEVIEALCSRRMAFLQGLKTWGTFGKGWGRRVAEVRKAALAMAGGAPAKPAQAPAPQPSKAAHAGLWAAIAAILAAISRAFDAHPWLIGGIVVAVIIAAIAAWPRKAPT